MGSAMKSAPGVAVESGAAAADGGNGARGEHGRLLWVDVGKGLSIVGVVVYHVVIYTGDKDTVFRWFSDSLLPIRMSLFFLLSGLFAHKVSEMTWGDLFRRKLWFWLVPYLAWSVVSVSVMLNFGNVETRDLPIWSYVFVPGNGLWFLYGLMVFTIVARALRQIEPAVVMWAVVVLSLVSPLLELPGGLRRMMMFAPYFFIGLYCRRFLIEFSAERRGAGKWFLFTVVAVAFYKLGLLAYQFTVLGEFVAERAERQAVAGQLVTTWLHVVMYAGALPMGIFLALVLSGVPGVRTVLAWYGRNTLPIYLANESAIWLSFRVWVLWGPDEVPRWFVSSVLLAGTMATCHLVQVAARIPVIGWCVTPPPPPTNKSSPFPAPTPQGRRTGAKSPERPSR